ncbi:MAG: hypothetical protein F4X83_06370 [Chloroflexi bacterium]|nr:hypothetical protein [Chloroflexota bacterium]
MRIFSYVVARDFGFAPNPFYGVCTLATCKPVIRSVAAVGDWVIGTGSRTMSREGRLVYCMRITETMSFNQYWSDERFELKRPNLRGSMKQAFGDNIYSTDSIGQWGQLNSHHSYADGSPNQHNVIHDTKTDRVLLGSDFAYWGGEGPVIPTRFRDYDGHDICAGRNHRSRFPESMVRDFVAWLRSLDASGYISSPLDWPSTA